MTNDPKHSRDPEDEQTISASGAPALDEEATLARQNEALSEHQVAQQPVTIAGYRILDKLGQGGMGIVWEAEQEHPKRRVALKVLRRDHLVDDYHSHMFQREAETLARLTDSDIAATMVSEIGTIKGTLQYMSPEQARGDMESIDTRTDVYALGVILYELLTSRLPYEVTRAAIAEAVRIICEDPPTPMHQSWSGVRKLDADIGVEPQIEIIESTPVTSELPSALSTLGKLRVRQGRFDEAETVYLRAIDVLETDSPDDPYLGLLAADLARLYRDTGRLDEAETTFRRAVELMEASWGPSDPDYLEAAANLEELLSSSTPD